MKSIVRYVLLLAAAIIAASEATAQKTPRVVHVYVALADNLHQGIVPVPAALGNGDDPAKNLYWGAAFGVKTFFAGSKDWKQLSPVRPSSKYILETVLFYHGNSDTLLVADAYRGSDIKEAISDFLSAAAGKEKPIAFEFKGHVELKTVDARPDLVVYVGHDGLMDFGLGKAYPGEKLPKREAIILACASKQYFGAALKPTGAEPILWTTNLMAPEAYTLKAALDGWIAGETDEQVRERAAAAYAKYQRITDKAALKLFATGW